jgi:hypothetical protein
MPNNMPSGIGEDALKEFWLQKLPSNVMAIISSIDGSLDALASRAHRVMEASNFQNIDAFAQDKFTELAGAVSALTQQVQSLSQIVNSSRDPAQQRRQRPARYDVQQLTQECYYHACTVARRIIVARRAILNRMGRTPVRLPRRKTRHHGQDTRPACRE